eukprot:7370507-Alexandrium_andersonii.AAC.1
MPYLKAADDDLPTAPAMARDPLSKVPDLGDLPPATQLRPLEVDLGALLQRLLEDLRHVPHERP